MELFGVGAMEAGLVLVITLIVVGPHRFPEIAREGGKWYRTARRYANEVMRDARGAMAELEAEVKAGTDDLRSVREIGADVSAGARAARTDIEAIGSTTQSSLQAPRELDAAPEPPPAMQPPPLEPVRTLDADR